MMFKKLKIFCLSIFFLGITISLIGCKPPPSGEAAGIRYPILFIQLQQMELSSPLAMPVENIKTRQIQDTWGTARSGGRKHEGIDIFAKRGTAVLSATQGIVLRVGTDDLGGKVVWIVGPNLSRHYYAHLNDYADQIQQGDWVEVGEVIGYVGNTGNAKTTPPHLHYGIYLNGQGAVNPYPYLAPSS